ncbi:MAG: hypothetical protein U0791_23365 [Gemmataceae bacterium]
MRTCPFNGCGQKIPDKLFACRGHWFRLSRVEKSAIDTAYRRYLDGHIDVVELRRIQQDVLGNRGTA